MNYYLFYSQQMNDQEYFQISAGGLTGQEQVHELQHNALYLSRAFLKQFGI